MYLKTFGSVGSSIDKKPVERDITQQPFQYLISLVLPHPPLTFSSKGKDHITVHLSAQELFVCIILENSSLTSSVNGMNTYSALM